MASSSVERALIEVHRRLAKAREDLTVLDEQLLVLADAADDARVRSLVADTPMATHEHTDAQRHADAASRARAALVATIASLEHRQDELLGRLVL
ncbi:MAG: hypothetical protein ACYCTL_07085 [Acidimicrobiales bacterium]